MSGSSYFEGLKEAHYGVILADPPWHFRTWGAGGERRSAQRHYQCRHSIEIAQIPVWTLAAADCALVMWATWPMLDHARAVMAAWDFEYKTGGAWAKQRRDGAAWAMGTGYYWRSASEFWLFGTRGNPEVLAHDRINLIAAPRREHSRKPDQMHEDLEAMFAGPRCELFARARRPGWDVWGDEADKFDAPDAGERG